MNKEVKFTGFVTKGIEFKISEHDDSLIDFIERNKADKLDGSFVCTLYELLSGELDIDKSVGDTFEIAIRKL